MMDFGAVATVSISIKTIVMFALYFVLGAYALFSAIFYYHWQTYATDTKVSGLTLLIYFATTLPLLAVMLIMTFII